ncbi:MAG: hypothetical protein ACFFG0_45570 [Candidatus Thorarchaeota archaeon]
MQCIRLILQIPKTQISEYDEIDSIDEVSEIYKILYKNKKLEGGVHDISPEEEFWGHCSNLQVWVENGYDTRFLHRNLAFPLLKKLTDLGDPFAKQRFRKEIIFRYSRGKGNIINYLISRYFYYLNTEDLKLLFIECIQSENQDALNGLNSIEDFFLNCPTDDIRDLLDYTEENEKNIKNHTVKKIVGNWIQKMIGFTQLETDKHYFFESHQDEFMTNVSDQVIFNLKKEINQNLVDASRNKNDLVIILRNSENIFTQFEFHPTYIHWEVVSNKFLKENEMLSEEQIKILREMAFLFPDQYIPNYNKKIKVMAESLNDKSLATQIISNDIIFIFKNIFLKDLDTGLEFRHNEMGWDH